jgi:thiosulfate/3-mercaptopyruvate sulfurtransferase
MYNTFIKVDQLFEIYKDENIAIIDIRGPNEDYIPRNHNYLNNHIPNAFYADFKNEITGDGKGSNAARVWWQLRTLKFPSVAVLEGGFSQWVRKGYPLVSGEEQREKTADPISIPQRWEDGLFPLVELEEVKNNIETNDKLLIDSRDKDRFNAITSGVDPIDGHIPGSKHFHWAYNTDDNGLLLPENVLKTQLENLMGSNDVSNIIFSCGSGVTACFNILTSEHLGLGIPYLYVGSWSEWLTHYPDLKEP